VVSASIPVEQSSRYGVGAPAQSGGLFAVADEAIDARSQGTWGLPIVEEAAALAANSVGDAGVHFGRVMLRHDHRTTTVHGFANDVWIGVVQAGADDAVGRCVPRRDILLGAYETDSIGEAESPGELP
jgi:hypothetical protein